MAESAHDAVWACSSARQLAWLVRQAGADQLVDRLERAVTDGVRLLALTIDERDHPRPDRRPPDGLAELRAVLMNAHGWRQREGLDPPTN